MGETVTADIVLVTRMAVDIGGGRGRHCNEGWLLERLDLFERFCAPGVRAQTLAPLAWVLLLDATTPDWVAERLVKIAPYATVGRLGGEWSVDTVRGTLSVLGLAGHPTMRLDSDDILLPDALARMSASIRQRGRGVHSLPFGRQLTPEGLFARVYLQNPFICLVDDKWGRHVFDVEHAALRGERVHVASMLNSWVQVVHGGNLANEARGVSLRAARTRHQLASIGVEPLPAVPSWSASLSATLHSASRYGALLARRLPTVLRLVSSGRSRGGR